MTSQRLASQQDLTTHRDGVTRSRRMVVATALTVGAAAIAAMLVVRPWGERDELAYADLSPVRDGMWAGILVDALGFAVVGVCLGLAVCGLARTRGATWATVGALFTGLGGIAFAMGAFAFASLAWYATETAALSAADGAKVLDYVSDHP